jgi:hypothetical protein
MNFGLEMKALNPKKMKVQTLTSKSHFFIQQDAQKDRAESATLSENS